MGWVGADRREAGRRTFGVYDVPGAAPRGLEWTPVGDNTTDLQYAAMWKAHKDQSRNPTGMVYAPTFTRVKVWQDYVPEAARERSEPWGHHVVCALFAAPHLERRRVRVGRKAPRPAHVRERASRSCGGYRYESCGHIKTSLAALRIFPRCSKQICPLSLSLCRFTSHLRPRAEMAGGVVPPVVRGGRRCSVVFCFFCCDVPARSARPVRDAAGRRLNEGHPGAGNKDTCA